MESETSQPQVELREGELQEQGLQQRYFLGREDLEPARLRWIAARSNVASLPFLEATEDIAKDNTHNDSL